MCVWSETNCLDFVCFQTLRQIIYLYYVNSVLPTILNIFFIAAPSPPVNIIWKSSRYSLFLSLEWSLHTTGFHDALFVYVCPEPSPRKCNVTETVGNLTSIDNIRTPIPGTYKVYMVAESRNIKSNKSISIPIVISKY